MKRYLAGAAALLALAACGPSGESGTVAEETAPAAEPAETAGETADAGPAGFAQVDAARIEAADPAQWPTYGGTYKEQRYSALDQITAGNAGELGLAWYADYDGKTAKVMQEGTPLFIDGVLYVSTAWSNVYAFDARTGERLWRFDPEVPNEWAVNVCCGLVNRGIAAWNGKIYVGTLDGRLIAIDAETGEAVWSEMTIDQQWPYSITGPVRVVDGKVLVGSSGAEFGVRGYLAAYDAESGEQIWRFYTIPGNPAEGFENAALEMAADTWTGQWWRVGGGGTVWDATTYDPETGLIYIGVGNGSPWSAVERSPDGGDNLFLSSIVAIDADTGEYVWHYQTTPWETWDYTATQHIMVADIEIGGEARHVVMQAPKNGFLYVLDAATGELLRASPYTEINWADGVDMETGRPIIRPEARYDVTGVPFNSLPGPQGAHAWHPMAFSPDTGLVYIPTQDAYFYWAHDPDWEPQEVGFNLGVQFPPPPLPEGEPTGFQGHLRAMNPDTGEIVWSSDFNQGPTGGALATAGGLVFQGNGAGAQFRAMDASTGAVVWSTEAQTGVFAGPISYELDGEQYVAINAGATDQGDYFAPTYGRLLVFKLGGTATLPEAEPYTPRPLAPPPAEAPEEIVQAGLEHYGDLCASCHGAETDGRTRGATFPDLRRTPLLYTQDGFDAVVLDGARADAGMVGFSAQLTPEDTQALRAYLIAKANDDLEAQNERCAADPGGFGCPGADEPAVADSDGGAGAHVDPTADD